jgi:hypothetical protein
MELLALEEDCWIEKISVTEKGMLDKDNQPLLLYWKYSMQ